MVDVGSSKRLGKQLYQEFSGKNVPFMAASIAYHAFVSLAPILLFVLLIVQALGGGLEQRIVDIAQQSFPGPIADLVATVFEGEGTSPAASVVGLIVLVWGALKIFRSLDTAFSEIYETTDENSLVDKFADGAVVLVAAVIAVIGTVGVTAAFAALSGTVPYLGLLTPVVLVVGLMVAFLPMYYRFPDADLSVREVLPGTVFAAVGWAAFQALFQVYLGFSGGGTGNLFGGVIVVVTWLYFSGIVLLLGAVINAVLGGHTTGREGGVGSGAGGGDAHETNLTRTEFVEYLRSLRSDVTRRDGEIRAGEPRYPRPENGVEVIERAGDEGEQWEVTFRWRGREEDAEERRRHEAETDRQPAPADD